MSKPSFAPRKAKLTDIVDQAERLRKRFLALMDEDTQVYNRILELNARLQAGEIANDAYTGQKQAALKDCVRVPLRILRANIECFKLALQLSKHFYTPTASDLAIGVSVIQASCEGVFPTVETNLQRMTDARFGATIRKECRASNETATVLMNEIFSNTLKILSKNAPQ
jgi:formiminotetrahydrofolate cyclodeaminase